MDIIQIIKEVEFRAGELVDFKKSAHLSILSEVLSDLGFSSVKTELIKNLLGEADDEKSDAEKNADKQRDDDEKYFHRGHDVYVLQKDKDVEDLSSVQTYNKDDQGNYHSINLPKDDKDDKEKSGPEPGEKVIDKDEDGEDQNAIDAEEQKKNAQAMYSGETEQRYKDEAEAGKPEETKDPSKIAANVSKEVKARIKISEELKSNLTFILENRDTTRLKSGGGSNSPTVDEVIALQTFTTERMNQDKRRVHVEASGKSFNEEPYVHPSIKQRVINDNVLDESLIYLQDNLDDDSFQKLIKKFATGGAVPTHLTKLTKLKRNEDGYPGYNPNSVGYKRAREIIRLYLKNDGKSPVTGKPLPLSHMEPDHRLPFTTSDHEIVKSGNFPGLSLKPKYPPDGNSLQEINKKRKSELNEYEERVLEALEPLQAKYDDPTSNMDLLSGPVNQFKGSLINDKLLNSIRKKLSQNPEEKRLQDAYTTERKKLLSKHHKNRVENGDNPPYNEYQIRNADKVETNAMMKAHNYYHPDSKTFTTYINGVPDKNIPADTNYYEKLKQFWENKGVKLPAGMEDIDFSQHPFNKTMTVYIQAGRGRGGAKRRTVKGDHDYMVTQFKEFDYYGSSYEEDQGQEQMLNEARVKMNKKLDVSRIKILKVQLADPNLKDPSRKRDNRQAELDTLLDKSTK